MFILQETYYHRFPIQKHMDMPYPWVFDHLHLTTKFSDLKGLSFQFKSRQSKQILININTYKCINFTKYLEYN